MEVGWCGFESAGIRIVSRAAYSWRSSEIVCAPYDDKGSLGEKFCVL